MKLCKEKDGRSEQEAGTVTLKSVAERVGLTASTVSAVLNNSSASHSVPERTKKRILAAAHELNYRPNFFARSLRVKRTYTIGVILEEIGDAYGSVVISGIERYLREAEFFLSYRGSPSRQHAARNLLDDASGTRSRRFHHGRHSTDRRTSSADRGGCRPSQDQRSDEYCSGSPPCRLAGAEASGRSGARKNRLHEGFSSKRRFRRPMECDLRSRCQSWVFASGQN